MIKRNKLQTATYIRWNGCIRGWAFVTKEALKSYISSAEDFIKENKDNFHQEDLMNAKKKLETLQTHT